MANLKVTNITITVAVAAIVVVATISTIILSAKNGTPMANAQTATPQKTTTAVASNKMYKDGTYSAKGSYNSPGGEEYVTVTLTLASNVITDSKVVGNGDLGVSGTYQNMFIGGYKSMVVGKKIANVHLSHVSGSSLTSKGFNLALQNIESQAS